MMMMVMMINDHWSLIIDHIDLEDDDSDEDDFEDGVNDGKKTPK